MLGLLTLSVGLGVGLGLSQAPVTRPAGPTRGEVINVSGTCAKQAFPLKCELREARRNRVGLSTRVPQLVGLSFPHAISALSNAGLIYGVTYVESSEPAGTVVSQSYLPGTRLLQGVLVSLEVVSGVGSGSVMVPDVIGTAPPQAQIALNLVTSQSQSTRPRARRLRPA
jgi:hypothetical protein